MKEQASQPASNRQRRPGGRGIPADHFAVLVVGSEVWFVHLPGGDVDSAMPLAISKDTARVLGERLVLAPNTSDQVDDVARAAAAIEGDR